MKKLYLRPEIEVHGAKIETICLDLSDTNADPNKPILGRERSDSKDFEGSGAPNVDLW